MPAALADIGVLRRDDVPAAVDLAQHASADALAVLLARCILHHLALDPEPRVQDCDVGGDERASGRARELWVSVAVQGPDPCFSTSSRTPRRHRAMPCRAP